MCRVPSLLKGQWDNEWDGPPQDKDSRRMLKNLKECQMLKMQFTSSRCFKGDVVMHTTPPWAIDGDQGISLCSSMTSWEGTQLDETTSVSKQNSLESLEVILPQQMLLDMQHTCHETVACHHSLPSSTLL